MKLSVCKCLALLAVTLLISNNALAQRDLYQGTPDETVKKRAAQQSPPLWRIPLGPALVENMEMIGPDRLLVGVRKDFPGLPNLDYMLVDTEKGEIIWRYPRKGGEYDPLLIFTDLILFRIDDRKTVSLLALDAQTGKERWGFSQKGLNIIHFPALAGNKVIAVDQEKVAVILTAISLDSGKTVWQKTIQAKKGASLPSPLMIDEDICVFYNGVERLSAADGSSIFSQRELNFDENSPPPQLVEDTLYAIHSGNQLCALSVENGSIPWAVSLPDGIKYTNIYPLGERIYLRGISSSGDHMFYALKRENGEVIWSHSGREANVSNFIESEGLLYFGTAASLIALNKSDGKQVFSVKVTTTGRTFPVRIRKINDRIVYIGELVIAAYDAKSGQLKYKHGMTPGAPELHLNGLDAATPKLQAELGQASNQPGSNLSGIATMEMQRYQNLANTYSSKSWSARSTGDYSSSDMYFNMSQSARKSARFQANLAFAMSLVDLGLSIYQALQTKAVQTSIERQQMFRKSILNAYDKAETEEHAYRPHLEWYDVDDNYMTVSVIHLPTGRRRETFLSPQYLSYGLWNLINFEKGVVYYNGIGMDPSAYQLSKARRYYPYKKARTIQTFLIAMPVKIPR
jgi:outer membrane protein assembly factor BamB